jgi:hypothetical protein
MSVFARSLIRAMSGNRRELRRFAFFRRLRREWHAWIFKINLYKLYFSHGQADGVGGRPCFVLVKLLLLNPKILDGILQHLC